MQHSQEAALQAVKDLKGAYYRLFNTEDGKKVLADLAQVCYMGKTTFSETESRTFFNEGTRAVYLHIARRMTQDERNNEPAPGSVKK